MPNVMIAGGGSGGHVAPAIAIAEALRSRQSEVLIVHSDRAIDQKMMHETAFEATSISAKPLSLSPFGFVKFCMSFFTSARQAKVLIRRRNIKCVIATGGFVAAPALWAAKKLGVPAILLNIDKPAGKANRLASRWATTVLSTVDWPEVQAKIVPPPLRTCTISNMDQRANKLDLGLDPNKMTLLVTGASQGAGTINTLIPELAKANPTHFMNWEILHLAGPDKAAAVEKAYEDTSVASIVLTFTSKMGEVWGAADLAITRGGANTIAEIAFNAVPSIVLPYPYHNDDHQRTNAEPLESIGGILIETDYISLDKNLSHVGQTILSMLTDHQKRFEMQQALALDAPINGATVIADTVVASMQ